MKESVQHGFCQREGSPVSLDSEDGATSRFAGLRLVLVPCMLRPGLSAQESLPDSEESGIPSRRTIPKFSQTKGGLSPFVGIAVCSRGSKGTPLMSLGSQGRWAALGLALSALLATAGCRGLPLRRPQPGQVGPVAESAPPEVSVSVSNSESRSAPVAANANPPAPLAPEKPEPLSANSPTPVALAGSIQPQANSIQPKPKLSATPIADQEPTQPPGSKTPMLDAALARAEDLTLAVTADEPVEPAPAVFSPIPAELVPLGSITEGPVETKRVSLIDVMDAAELASEERKETSEADTPDSKTDSNESVVVADPRDPWDVGLERLRDLAKGRADGGGNAARD